MKRENNLSHVLTPILITCIIFLVPKSINAQEVENEREFEYDEDSEKGPKKWGKMKKEWEACYHGTMQSPIDMTNARVGMISQPEKLSYKPANATVKNRGHDIQIQWFGDAGSININDTKYPLKSAHWHSPSEHAVKGKRYQMELHMFHLSTDPKVDRKMAVVGVFYKFGEPDQFLTKLMKNITSIKDMKDEERPLGIVDPNDIKIPNKRYYRYIGSLTTPPCTEGVIWTINDEVKTVSREQVKAMREAVDDYAERNARPLQPGNNRDVYLYGSRASS